MFFLASRGFPSCQAMACDGRLRVAIAAAIIALLRRLALPEATVVAYACIRPRSRDRQQRATSDADGRPDDARRLLLVSKRKVAGAVAVALATLAKPYAVLVLPAFWHPWDWRVPLAVAAAVLACYLPYLGAGWGVFGFLTGYISEEGLSTGSGIWLVALAQTLLGNVPGLTASYAVVAAGIMAWLGLRVAFGAQHSPRETLADILLLLTAGLFLMSPNYAWYFLALVPFIPLATPPAQAPIWALTLGAFLLYRPLYLPHNELIWKTLATLPFVLAAALAWRNLRRSA
jgi:hypothetical protein